MAGFRRDGHIYIYIYIYVFQYFHTHLHQCSHIYKFRMEDEELLNLDNDVIVKETQDTPNTFSKNLIQKLGICRNLSSGTEAVSSNNPSVDT